MSGFCLRAERLFSMVIFLGMGRLGRVALFTRLNPADIHDLIEHRLGPVRNRFTAGVKDVLRFTQLEALADWFCCEPKLMEYVIWKYHGSCTDQKKSYWMTAMKPYSDVCRGKDAPNHTSIDQRASMLCNQAHHGDGDLVTSTSIAVSRNSKPNKQRTVR